jgi:hypothetical protein
MEQDIRQVAEQGRADASGVCGLGIFDASPEDVERIMSLDPGVQAGVFIYDIHPTRRFPRSFLPIPRRQGRGSLRQASGARELNRLGLGRGSGV